MQGREILMSKLGLKIITEEQMIDLAKRNKDSIAIIGVDMFDRILMDFDGFMNTGDPELDGDVLGGMFAVFAAGWLALAGSAYQHAVKDVKAGAMH